MNPEHRIVLAFVERLFLNESGRDMDGWTQDHMEEVAKALEAVDQPGAAGVLRLRWNLARHKRNCFLTTADAEGTANLARLLGVSCPKV